MQVDNLTKTNSSFIIDDNITESIIGKIPNINNVQTNEES